ncbi:MAG: hypothetical protein AAF108_10165 [Planctomycetota bacterium]
MSTGQTQAPIKIQTSRLAGCGSWLVLLAGLSVVAASVLIPAEVELRRVHDERDRVVAEEAGRRAWLDRHLAYRDALAEGRGAVLIDVARRQLGKRPAGWQPVEPTARASADPFLTLGRLRRVGASSTEPKSVSVLERWFGDRRTGAWGVVLGGVCVFWALLPPASRLDRATPTTA